MKSWSLRTQVFLLLCSVMLISFIAIFLMMRVFVMQPAAEQFAGMVATEIQLFTQMSDLIGSDKTATLAHKAGILIDNKPVDSGYPSLAFYRKFRQALMKELHVSQLSIMVGTGRIWLSSPDDPEVWLGFPFPDYISKTMNWLLLSLSVSLIFGGLAAWLYARYLRKPLEKVPAAIAGMGHDCSVPCIEETGPMEVRALLRGVNETAEQSCRLAEDRQLMMVGISHDLRGPISRVRIAAEMLDQDELKDAVVEDLNEMDGILEGFFQLVSGINNLPWTQVNISDLLQALAKRQLRHGQEVQLHLPDEAVFVYLPVTAFERVIDNLVRNAWKHGQPPIEIHLQLQGEQVCISVEDHGKGIPLNDRDRLLKPFQQGQTARTIGGAGLGLAIACRLTELMKGRLELQQQDVGTGLVVALVFPVSRPVE